jgi:hypothetical protein
MNKNKARRSESVVKHSGTWQTATESSLTWRDAGKADLFDSILLQALNRDRKIHIGGLNLYEQLRYSRTLLRHKPDPRKASSMVRSTKQRF